MPIRFVFALHNHQPVGNFDGVFEAAYRESYAPFLELLETIERDNLYDAVLDKN